MPRPGLRRQRAVGRVVVHGDGVRLRVVAEEAAAARREVEALGVGGGEPALALEPLKSPPDEPDAEAAAWGRARTLPDGRGAPRSGAGRESTSHIPDSSMCLVATRLYSAMAWHAQPMLHTCHLQSQANPEYDSAITDTASNALIVRL